MITASDSGGTLEYVVDGVNGAVVPASPDALAGAINAYAADRAKAASHGDAGYLRASAVSWEGVIEKLVGA